jgi:hypothetical protein
MKGRVAKDHVAKDRAVKVRARSAQQDQGNRKTADKASSVTAIVAAATGVVDNDHLRRLRHHRST